MALIEVGESRCDAAAWDAFAQSCDASFRCGHRAARMWQFERHLLFRTVYLDIELTGSEGRSKIGQCAVGMGRKTRVFADTVQLLPEHRHRWREAMAVVLAELGSGLYSYGSEWTLDGCRGGDLAAIPGVSLRDRQPLDVVAIDFEAWPTWEAYYGAVSTNAKRNVRKLERSELALDIRLHHGSGVLRNLVPLQLSRHRLFKRKSVGVLLPRLIGRSAFRFTATHTYSRLAELTADGASAAFLLDIQFGRNTFFMEAAPAGEVVGASSYLLKAMIAKSYTHGGGRGRFVMGPDDHRHHGEPGWEGLKRSREQWRATAHPTSIATFSYSAA